MKAYTDIEQSIKLAKILPTESADMYWDLLLKDNYAKVNNIGHCLGRTCVYAWSLAALVAFLKNQDSCMSIRISNKEVTAFYYKYNSWKEITIKEEDAIDACVELIIKLKKKGLI